MVSPRAKGSLMRMTFSPHNPKREPSVPVATTKAAVRDGMPPYMDATSTAKGMETPLGRMEITTSSGRPPSLAITPAESMAAKAPAQTLARMGKALRSSRWR